MKEQLSSHIQQTRPAMHSISPKLNKISINVKTVHFSLMLKTFSMVSSLTVLGKIVPYDRINS